MLQTQDFWIEKIEKTEWVICCNDLGQVRQLAIYETFEEAQAVLDTVAEDGE